MIRVLPRVVPAAQNKPVRDGAASTQKFSRAIAEDPSIWSAAMARKASTRYTELARVWDADRGGYRSAPLADALARGGPLPAGRCVEVGCGTSLLTPLLANVWSSVVSVDLTWDMLTRSSAPWRVRCDAAALPLANGQADAVVLADVPLFADEVTRVLADDGVVVWSNALGYDAPHHVPIRIVMDGLTRASGGTPWSGVSAEAGWGLWAVLRRG